MKREVVVGVQPAVLRWARGTVGLALDDVACALKRPVAEIAAWENGSAAPSYAQLEKLAYQLYKRPLAVFFLPQPPEEQLPQREFRTLPATDLQTLARDTHLHIRHARAYQIALRELFDGQNPAVRRIWQHVALHTDGNVVAQAANIRAFLGLNMADQAKWQSDDLALKKWRQMIEDAGIFIFKGPFKQADISGFCLMDQHFPLIYLNNSSTKTRQIFSLLHELAHLLMSMNGLSKFGTDYIENLPRAEQRIEQFCNAIAAEVLIPQHDFMQELATLPGNVESLPDAHFEMLAKRYGVSREAILRRFLDQGRVSRAFYQGKTQFWTGQMKKTPSGGDWYASKNTYLSTRFAQEVIGKHYRQQLTLEQAADFLGVRVKNFIGLEQRILQGANA